MASRRLGGEATYPGVKGLMQMNPEEVIQEAQRTLWDEPNEPLFKFLSTLGYRVPKPTADIYDDELRFLWSARNVGLVVLQMKNKIGGHPRKLVVDLRMSARGEGPGKYTEQPSPEEVVFLISYLFEREKKLKAEGKVLPSRYAQRFGLRMRSAIEVQVARRFGSVLGTGWLG